MTTIAYKDGILASDSLVTGNGMRCGMTVKISKGKNGMGGCAGSASDAEKLTNWIKNGGSMKKPPELSREIDGLYIRKNGKTYYYADGGFSKFKGKFAAVGSGERYAMAAMQSGKSAKGAVKIACKLDCYSGGKINIIKR